MPFGAPVEDVMAIIDEDGGIILEGVLSQEVLDEVNEQLDPELEQLHTGSTHDDELAKMFHGELTKRLTNVVTFAQVCRMLCSHIRKCWNMCRQCLPMSAKASSTPAR